MAAYRAGVREFVHLDLTDVDLTGSILDGARFRRCRFVRTKLEGASMRDCFFGECEAESIVGVPVFDSE